MLVTILIRAAITLTFLILAAGGPYAIAKLRSFIQSYTDAHAALELRVKNLESRIGLLEEPRDEGKK